MSNWHFIFLLHNLSVKEPIEYDNIAIVPSTDDRIVQLIKKNNNIENLVNNFTDQFSRKITPSILIVRDGAPKSLYSHDALVGFRNIVAISFIIPSWQNFLCQKQPARSANYSNYFDIYPISPTSDGDYLVNKSPSILGIDYELDKFCGQCSPELAKINTNKDYDKELLNALLKSWKERYVGRKTRDYWELRALFRSLEMAYQACSIPFENNSTIYDYGCKVCLWVSAFEILIHPKIGNANLPKVIDLLGKAKFSSKRLRNKYYRTRYDSKKKQKERLTLPQKLYSEIYYTRCNFLHGNPVNIEDIFPFKNKKRYPLNSFAPLLYSLALRCFLGIFQDISDIPNLSQKQRFNYWMLEDGLEKALEDRETTGSHLKY